MNKIVNRSDTSSKSENIKGNEQRQNEKTNGKKNQTTCKLIVIKINVVAASVKMMRSLPPSLINMKFNSSIVDRHRIHRE